METSILFGILITAMSGLVMGVSPGPLKFLKQFKYEQFGFISMFVALLLIPWALTIILCPDIFTILSEIDSVILIKANLFSMCWGIAQILAMLCFIRIGVSLTYGILCAIGASVGVITPMVFKASGIFSEAPSLVSQAGLIILFGVAVMIMGVYFSALAGLKREKMTEKQGNGKKSGSMVTGLIMVILAGFLSTGWGFAFTYSQDSIFTAMAAHGVPDFASKIALWAVVLFGAALINILYPVYLLTRNKSWHIIPKNSKDILLSAFYGLLFFIPSVLLGKGMLLLGALGASVGWGINQGLIIIGGQILGFSAGEWKGVSGKPRRYIFIAIAILIVSMVILAIGNTLS